MAIQIKFDSSHNVIPPTLVLTTRNGNRLGGLLYHNLVVKQAIRQSMEMSFTINRNDYTEKKHNADLWNLITDFKLVWCKEWNCYFEIAVTTNEEFTTDKEITAVSLGDAELSQINLYDIQINTEDDIAREDYEPTVLYNPLKPNASLLHRIMEKVPHYTVKYVDAEVQNIQRTFTFDSKSLYDAFQEIAEEMECVFDIVCRHGTNGIERNISVYALENYGNDTNILLSTDALADNINYSVDTGAVKNCFRLEAGDDLMTATIRNCNPNGSGYIWYISDELKSDMSDDLVEKLEAYNHFYDYYYNDYDPFNPTTTGLPPADAAKVSSIIINYPDLRSRYNTLIDKYSVYTTDYQKIDTPMVGYPSIMEAYYNTVDFYYYLNDSLMPDVQMSDTTAQAEANKLTSQSLNETAVQNLSATTSVATVNSAIGAMAKAIIDTRYQIRVLDDECSFTYSEQGSTWNGKIKVTNYSDEEDTATATLQGVIISGDYAKFIQQKIETALANTRTDTISDIVDLFELSDNPFKAELKKYSLQRLKAFHDACQGCIDILIQQGIASDNNTQSSMYQQIYLPYYNKLGFIQTEMDLRQSELDLVYGTFDSEGGLLEYGMQTVLGKERDKIQENLDFQEYLGTNIWQEFVAYRREDTYSNTNYVSDGLGNDDLFSKAMEFIETAKDEIEKSATKQHTINARLKNLLVMKEFSSIVDCFEVGNWLRLKVDGKLFTLRLVDYQIDFENLESIDITFSDIVVEGTEGTAKDILNHAASMATSYNTVSRQARNGDKGSKTLDNWVDDGLALTTTKIIDTADNQEVSWDKHGLICREYDSLTDSYSDTQLKLINKGVYITNNNWQTAKAGIGNFTFFNPAANNGEGAYQESYGVIADTLVGNLILGENVGIYNTMNSITMDENGFTLTTNGTGNNDPQSVFTIRRKTVNGGVTTFKDMFYIDDNGFVTINGGVKIHIDGGSSNSTMVEMVDGKIATSASEIKSTVSSAVSKYDTTNKTVHYYGYGTPGDNGYAASSYSGKYYLDQNNGKLYVSNGSSWSVSETLTLITTNLQTQITQNATEITSKVSTGDFGTLITQNAENVRIAWNNITEYISFENAAIKVKNSSNKLLMQLNNSGMRLFDSSEVLLAKFDSTGIGLYELNSNLENCITMKLDRDGTSYYDDSISIGKIGTNNLAGDGTVRGLLFNLETKNSNESARFMGWAYRESSSAQTSTLKMAYYTNDFTYNSTTYKKGFHFGDDVYYKGNLYMNNYTIYDTVVTSSSDARLKTNISSSQIAGLFVLNKIEVSEFDWIETNKHVDAGLIAQQLHEIIPDAVLENPYTHRLSIRNDVLIPYIIKAIQELTNCIGDDNKCKAALQSLGVSNFRERNKWLDKTNIEQKKKFIAESRPAHLIM